VPKLSDPVASGSSCQLSVLVVQVEDKLIDFLFLFLQLISWSNKVLIHQKEMIMVMVLQSEMMKDSSKKYLGC
jgi:hypothetical protein